MKRLDDVAVAFHDVTRNKALVNAMWEFISKFVGAAGRVLTAYAAFQLLKSGNLTPRGFAQVISIQLSMIQALATCAKNFDEMFNKVAATDEIDKFVDDSKDVNIIPNHAGKEYNRERGPAITVDRNFKMKAGKSEPGDQSITKDAVVDGNTAQPEGVFICIKGASGAGKSSVFSQLLGWHSPPEGTNCVQNIFVHQAGKEHNKNTDNLNGFNMSAWRRCVSHAAAATEFLDGNRSWAEIIACHTYRDANRDTEGSLLSPDEDTPEGGKKKKETIRRAIQIAEAADFIPDPDDGGFTEAIGANNRKLSDGEKKRLGLVRALCKSDIKPEDSQSVQKWRLLLLDEPTKGVGEKMSKAIIGNLMGAQKKGDILHERSIAIIAHSATTIATLREAGYRYGFTVEGPEAATAG